MVSKESLRQTLEYFSQQRQAKLQEIKSLDFTIRQLEKELGEASTEAPIELTNSDAGLPVVNGSSQSAQSSMEIRPDEFYGMSQSDAAKAYLRKAHQAVSLGQLLDGMTRGGAKVGGEDPKRTLYVSLMRNPKKEFVVIGDDNFGLREFYPHLPKTGTSRGPKGKRPKRRRAKSLNKSKQNTEQPQDKTDQKVIDAGDAAKETAKNEIRAAVIGILKDGQPQVWGNIHLAVERELGREVSKMAVYGILRNKKLFEGAGGKVRLIRE